MSESLKRHILADLADAVKAMKEPASRRDDAAITMIRRRIIDKYVDETTLTDETATSIIRFLNASRKAALARAKVDDAQKQEIEYVVRMEMDDDLTPDEIEFMDLLRHHIDLNKIEESVAKANMATERAKIVASKPRTRNDPFLDFETIGTRVHRRTTPRRKLRKSEYDY